MGTTSDTLQPTATLPLLPGINLLPSEYKPKTMRLTLGSFRKNIIYSASRGKVD